MQLSCTWLIRMLINVLTPTLMTRSDKFWMITTPLRLRRWRKWSWSITPLTLQHIPATYRVVRSPLRFPNLPHIPSFSPASSPSPFVIFPYCPLQPPSFSLLYFSPFLVWTTYPLFKMLEYFIVASSRLSKNVRRSLLWLYFLKDITTSINRHSQKFPFPQRATLALTAVLLLSTTLAWYIALCPSVRLSQVDSIERLGISSCFGHGGFLPHILHCAVRKLSRKI